MHDTFKVLIVLCILIARRSGELSYCLIQSLMNNIAVFTESVENLPDICVFCIAGTLHADDLDGAHPR